MRVKLYEKKGGTQPPYLKGMLKRGSVVLLSSLCMLQANAGEGWYKTIPGYEMNANEDAGFFKTIRGKVVDEEGNPVAGVAVSVNNRKAAVSTAPDGTFTIEANEGEDLVFTHISFVTKTVKVGAETNISITLQQSVNDLEQVTVTGYTNYSRSKSPSASAVVSSKDINKVPMSSVDQILQGRVAGLSVISSSGQPGQSAAVVIRGIGSINGSNTPLYVMDGIPIESGYFQTINPEDIESMNVLKDASAKALYGSRGSNGVIVITTKKGRKGRLSVGYSSQYGISKLTQPAFEMTDATERLKFEEEVGSETGRDIGPGWRFSPLNPNYATQSPAWQQRAGVILDSLRNMNTDWRDMFFQNASFMEQQINLSGGNENVQTYNGLSFWKEDGIVKETGMHRLSFRSNTNLNYGKFTAGFNLNLGYSNSKFTYNEGGTGVGSPMASVYYGLPYEYPYTADGVFHPTDQTATVYDTREGSRGIDVLYGTSDRTQQFKTTLGIDLGYEIIKGLKVTTRAGIDFRNSVDEAYINPSSYIGSRQTGLAGYFSEGFRRNFSLVSTSGITYKKRLDIHDFEVSGFYEYLQNNYRDFSYTGYRLDDRIFDDPNGITGGAAFPAALDGGRLASAMSSLMGVGRYTLNNKYTLTASYRYDGASLSSVPDVNRWHGFYSFGATWDAKKEQFLSNVNLISDLRVRASYGQTASPFGTSFGYYPTYTLAGTNYGNLGGIRPNNLGNPDFNWEYVDEFNAGFDLGLFDSQRLKIVFDWYNKLTKGMFIDQPVSATAGGGEGTSIMLSTGRMRNRGVELSISGDIIKNKDLNWNVGINGAFNENRILRVTDLTDQMPDGDTRVIKVGLPYGTYFAPVWAGVDPANGDALYYNPDGTITNVYNADVQSVPISASMFPKLTGGITTNVRWKQFSLDALFSFVSGVDRWNNIDFYIENQAYMTSNQSKRMLYDRWKKPGDNATLQRIDIPRRFTSKDIQDAAFMRLRNVKISYSVPVALLNKIKVLKSVDIFVQGQNLLTWTTWRGLDPENNRQYGRFEYPNARKYIGGISVNF